MIKTKRQMFLVVGTFALILLLGTVSYAFFNYTRTGASNTASVGRIYFNTDQNNDTLTLTNVFPSNSVPAGADSVSVHIVGDTAYFDGEEYQITLVNVVNTINEGTANEKTVPINYVAEYTATTSKTVGTQAVSDYYSERTANVYDLTSTGVVEEGVEVLKGYIAPGAIGIDGTLTIKAYLDASKVVISDTLTGGAVSVQGYTNGTPTSEGVTVLTTSEWNALQGNSTLSFKIKAEANEGKWIPSPDIYPTGIKCKRVTDATKLHTETCSQTDNYCAGDGYTGDNTLITYGNAKQLNTQLTAGDAFDCDVNGNGVIDTENGISTERFYYVSKLWKPAVEEITTPNLNDSNFDSNYSVLIYYKNFVNGSPSDDGVAYYATAGENWHGPVTAVGHLPTTSTWSNVSLSNTSRTIYACDNTNCSTMSLKTYSNTYTIQNPFSYTGYAARFLSLPELVKGCLKNSTLLGDNEALKECNFIFESTRYSDASKATIGIWLENPRTGFSDNIWITSAKNRNVASSSVTSSIRGVRPTLEVPITSIAY